MAEAAIVANFAALGRAGGVLGPAKNLLVTNPATGFSHVDYVHGGI
jgi:hypothetical protein